MHSSDELMELLLIKNIVDNIIHSGNHNVGNWPSLTQVYTVLHMPYLAYGRQDRHTEVSQPFSLKVFAQLINSMNFDRVVTYDAHSDTAGALIKNLVSIPQSQFAKHWYTEYRIENQYIAKKTKRSMAVVAPDAGAEKKALAFAKSIDKPLITATKIRNPADGAIIGTSVHAAKVPTTCVIVDDICDGGRTFIELAKVLRSKGAQKIYLFTTHGIYSKGTVSLYEAIDEIYCANFVNFTGDDVDKIPVSDVVKYYI